MDLYVPTFEFSIRPPFVTPECSQTAPSTKPQENTPAKKVESPAPALAATAQNPTTKAAVQKKTPVAELTKAKAVVKAKATAKKTANTKLAAKKSAASSVKKATPPKKSVSIKKEVDLGPAPEVWKWWEQSVQKEEPLPGEQSENLVPGQKWTSLVHFGPLLSPPYEKLPAGVQMLYAGNPVPLSLPSEEVACMFAAILETDYAKNPTFKKNFYRCWRSVMTPDEKKIIRRLETCNFTPIAAYFKQEKEKSKNITPEEKKKRAHEKLDHDKKYMYALVDGREQKVSNFRIEPPGLLRGRGAHPKMGTLKKRVTARDITLNLSKGASIPPVPDNGIPNETWGNIVHLKDVTWLAKWPDTITGKPKYVWLDSSSRLKGESDMKKYEVSRKLKGLIGEIRKRYMKDLKSEDTKVAQRATAVYFIDRLALRHGGDGKNLEEEADTVGCCSLRVEHMTLLPGREMIQFDFLGKDSVRYFNTVKVDPQVYANVQKFTKRKLKSDLLFDANVANSLNAYLTTQMPGLTAKVFRTYNASSTLQNELNSKLHFDEHKSASSENYAALALQNYSRANRTVALLCNHQKGIAKSHSEHVLKLKERLITLKKNISELKKKKQALDSGSKMLDSVNKSLKTHTARLKTLEMQLLEKEENKSVALNTSKINYLDPRITIAYAKRVNLPIEKFFNAAQRQKFSWALDTDASFVW